MAEEKKENTMIDPIAYRNDYNPENIDPNYRNDPNIPGVGSMNANLNYQQYGDDSNPAWQGQKGGLNPKYEGEGVSNTYIAYDPNIKTSGLNPDYKFGEAARQQNALEAGYIAKRNDMIASALYNEGKVGREDVANYLASQQGWMNSTQADRDNTTDSIWKRLGQIQPQQESKKAEPITIGEDKNQEELIYGKITPETGIPQNGVIANTDDNIVLNQMNAARTSNMNALRSMDPTNAATSTYFGYTPYGDQTLRDVQQYDQVWYQQYREALTKLYAQDQIDEISHGSAGEGANLKIDSYENNIINDQSNWINQNSDERTYDQVAGQLNKRLLSNQTASSAKQEMINIKKDIADLNSKLEDLPNKANKAFKGDVPDYIYKAYIANNTQEIQKKIQNLENRYASLSDIYKTEVSQTQWEMEFDLKKDQLEMDRTKMNFDMAYKTAQLEQDKIHWDNGKAYTTVNGQVIQLDDGTAFVGYQNKVNGILGGIEQMAQNNAKYGQCEQFTDDMAETTAGVRMEGADGRTYTTSDEKNWYATQFGLFSDYIPEVGDVAVFDYRNAKNVSEDSRKYGHTMYVAGYDEATGMIHLIGSNGNGDLANRVYSKDMSVQDFYANYGKGFWNPYKYAQWQSMRSKNKNNGYSPMQGRFDDLIRIYRDAGKSNLMQDVATLQEAYTTLWRDVDNGDMMTLIEEGDLGKFLNNVALFRQNNGNATGSNINDKNGSIKDTLSSFLGLDAREAAGWAARYAAQNVGDAQAYKAFQDIMRVIEIKLRDESGAAINQGEWGTDFMLYMPQAGDSQEVIKGDLDRMEEYIRSMAAAAGITSDEYIPLFTDTGKRSID